MGEFREDAARRSERRLELSGAVRGEVTVVVAMDILDVSVTGMKVETLVPLHVDSVHDFRLTLGSETAVVRGRIAYARISDVDREGVRYCSGVEYVDVPERVVAMIGKYLAETRAARAPGT